MELKKCLLTNNDCYKAKNKMNPVGIVVHSTGANNPNLRRYIQPDDGILGVNKNNNHWNRSGLDVCVHAFIGKDKNGEVRCYQTLPFNYCSWGVGRGKKGSYNYPASKSYPNDQPYIQFEICEDALTDQAYFEKVMKCAQEFCAYLIKEYPAITIDNVISHNEANKRGFGSNHKDCDHWLAKFGKNMDWFRACVRDELYLADAVKTEEPAKAEETKKTYIVQKGDTLSGIAKKYNTTYKILGEINGIKFPWIIRVGQELILP